MPRVPQVDQSSRTLLKFVCTKVLSALRYDKLLVARAGDKDKTQQVGGWVDGWVGGWRTPGWVDGWVGGCTRQKPHARRRTRRCPASKRLLRSFWTQGQDLRNLVSILQ